MRAGGYTIHQSLTADAAAVLKLALDLARRRGHAQVTPLHVAFALLTAPSSPPPVGVLRRACLRSHPGPLQCRALELCFNVALNRLPTSAAPPGGSSSFASSLIHPCPTLSNALVAALKRAQASQRRGCVELQAASSSSSTQQPMLAIKVELEQLVVSILDDPTVSRVMREAGFSSATVKTDIEEDSSALLNPPSSSPPQTQPHLFHSWKPAQLLPGPMAGREEDDVRAVMDVMLRKRGGSTCSPVVVGDSAWAAESVAGELLRRLERGDVPEGLAGAHLLKLQLSYVHVRLMTRADVAARAAELRRAVQPSSAAAHRGTGLVVFVGDLRWAVRDDEAHQHEKASYSPVEHMAAELGRLVDDVRAARGRAWLVATASYQTYMRWRRRPAAWALQAVLVPTAGGTGLALNNLHHHDHPSATSAAAGVQPPMATMMQSSPFAMARDEAENLVLCSECSRNFEREASLVSKSSEGGGDARPGLPAWLVPAEQSQPKDAKYLLELRRKWSRLCRKLHLCIADAPCSPAASTWWPGCGPCMPPPSSRPSIAGLLGLEGLMAAHGNSSGDWSTPPARWGLAPPPLGEPADAAAGTALALGANRLLLPLSDTASSGGHPAGSGGDAALERRLRRNVPWQPAAVAAAIAEAVEGEDGNGVAWLHVKGGDRAAVLRAAAVVAADRAVVSCGDASRFGCAAELCSDVVSRVGGGSKRPFVLVLGDVERAAEDVVGCIVAASSSGSITDPSTSRELDLAGSVVILTTAKLSTVGDEVVSLRLWSQDEEEARGCGDRKRKLDAEPSPTERSKRQRHDHDDNGFDLNIDLCAADDDDMNDDPSDLTHEGSSSSSVDDEEEHTHRLLESVAAVITLADDDERAIRGHLRAVLARALGTAAHVEDEAVEALAAASGRFLEDTMERWAAEVLWPAVAAATVRTNGGKEGNVVVLGVGGAPGQGFMGSVLPSRLHVD